MDSVPSVVKKELKKQSLIERIMQKLEEIRIIRFIRQIHVKYFLNLRKR